MFVLAGGAVHLIVNNQLGRGSRLGARRYTVDHETQTCKFV